MRCLRWSGISLWWICWEREWCGIISNKTWSLSLKDGKSMRYVVLLQLDNKLLWKRKTLMKYSNFYNPWDFREIYILKRTLELLFCRRSWCWHWNSSARRVSAKCTSEKLEVNEWRWCSFFSFSYRTIYIYAYAFSIYNWTSWISVCKDI